MWASHFRRCDEDWTALSFARAIKRILPCRNCSAPVIDAESRDMSTAIHLVLVTCPVDHASTLAEILVRENHAACVNIIPKITSVYRWEEKITRDEEALLIIKTAAENFESLKQAVLRNHPYELPEILAVNPADGHAPYLE